MFVNFFGTEALEAQKTQETSRISLDRVAVIVLGGGEGKRLDPLTKSRCKPAISFGGRYSLIDIPISHSLTTGLKKIFVIGQYLAYTLQKHLFQTYMYHGISQNQIQLLVPEEREGKKIWYKGTADAIRQNINYFSEVSADYFLILSGDQLYNINFQEMINFAVEHDAGMVIAAQPVNEKNAKRMGLLKLKHGSTQVVDFVEKPEDKAILEQYYVDDFTLHRLGFNTLNTRRYLGSMGIYLFKREVMFNLLNKDPREDFGKHLITTQIKHEDVHAYLYDGYWEDIGTIESYYHANLALIDHLQDTKQGLQCYDEKNMILTKMYNLPGTKIRDTIIDKVIICEGCIIEAQEITHSIIGVRSVIAKGCIIRDSILMGNEFYEKPEMNGRSEKMSIGEKCVINKAIIDENVTMGKGVKLINQAGHTHYDSPEGSPPICVRDGIIIVPRGTTLPDGFVF